MSDTQAARMFRYLWLPIGVIYCWFVIRFYRVFIYATDKGTIWGLADDIYISAAFGRNLFSGHGPLWYPGAPRVEGVTNPLWTVVLGAMHLLPGMTEENLGLFVISLNALLLFVVAWAAWRVVLGSLPAGAHVAPESTLLWLCFLVSTPALSYWASEGFETALIGALALTSLGIAMRDHPRAPLWVGGLLGLALWTRMDAALYFAGTLIVLVTASRNRLRDLFKVGAISGAMLAVLVLGRWLYFGETVPNTYYLKATGWPLSNRIALGLERNVATLPTAVIACVALALPAVRRRLRGSFPLVAGCVVTFSASVLYSVNNGGDAWTPRFGYDRYTAVGGMFLATGLAVVAATFVGEFWARFASLSACMAIAFLPTLLTPDWAAMVAETLVAEEVTPRRWERRWIEYGRAFEEISHPGARMALCPAGAIVYFSHRGGVDLLGKMEPIVSRSNTRLTAPKPRLCWRGFAGHNKEESHEVFKQRRPEFSRVQPPEPYAGDYVAVSYGKQQFYALRSSPYVRWEKLSLQEENAATSAEATSN